MLTCKGGRLTICRFIGDGAAARSRAVRAWICLITCTIFIFRRLGDAGTGRDARGGLEKYDFLQTPAPHRGVVELRYITALYSMDWDPALGEMARSLAHQFVDLDSPCGIYEEMSPSPLYKTGRNLVTLYDYYRLTGDELAKKGMEQIIEYKFRFCSSRRRLNTRARSGGKRGRILVNRR